MADLDLNIRALKLHYLAAAHRKRERRRLAQQVENERVDTVIAECGVYIVTVNECWPLKPNTHGKGKVIPGWERAGVYIVKDHSGAAIYVGYSIYGPTRIYQHCVARTPLGCAIREQQPASGDWTVEWYPELDRKKGLAREAALIRMLQPVFNEKVTTATV